MAKKVQARTATAKRRKAAGRGEYAANEQLSAARGRKDGRHQILLYMKPDLIADLKQAALDEGMTAFGLVEKAVAALLARRKKI